MFSNLARPAVQGKSNGVPPILLTSLSTPDLIGSMFREFPGLDHFPDCHHRASRHRLLPKWWQEPLKWFPCFCSYLLQSILHSWELLTRETLSLLCSNPCTNSPARPELKPVFPGDLHDLPHVTPVSIEHHLCPSLSPPCALFLEWLPPRSPPDRCSHILRLLLKCHLLRKALPGPSPEIPTLHPRESTSLVAAIVLLSLIVWRIYLFILSLPADSMRSGNFVYFVNCWIPTI